MSGKISQREARRLRKEVTRLRRIIESQNLRWSAEWPSSTVICREEVNVGTLASIRTARALHHAVIAVVQDNKIAFFASEHLPV